MGSHHAPRLADLHQIVLTYALIEKNPFFALGYCAVPTKMGGYHIDILRRSGPAGPDFSGGFTGIKFSKILDFTSFL